MVNVLVTGGNGQLATCIKDIEKEHGNLNLMYTDYLELDICDLEAVQVFFKKHKTIHYCINCAAYTAVDKAETEQEKAHHINAIGAKNLAIACKANETILIHISTDFVFDGEKTTPYTELDETNPISVYGDTKLKGEMAIKDVVSNYFIVRTAWLYSEHGTNFMKTMLRLAKEKDELSIISDQFGTPTYAGDLAQLIFHIIESESENYGLYHYSNEGEISWYDFAKAIFEISGIEIKLNAIPTSSYPTPAKRPKNSVMDKSKIKNDFNVEIAFWKDSLQKALLKLNN